ncbi:MAG: UbiX family flavin prenyltransferase [Candidatus Micrarchaeota archaeon]
MRILLVITGASGIVYGTKLAQALKEAKQDVKIVISSGAKKVAEAEGMSGELPPDDYSESDFSCPYASGSNAADAVVICPCSLKTLGEIANGVGSSLITRAAEVALKERKKLILVVRETPYSLIAIENMRLITLACGIILPASPGFYHQPKTIEQLVDFVCGKVMDQLSIKHKLFKRWKE